jgi:hypothetical protein
MPPMRRALALTLVTAFTVQDPAATAARQLTLELRVFDGTEEVTGHVRATVHRTGDRGEPLRQARGGADGLQFRLPDGIYDVQAIHERDGRVLNIRWANRLVVMPYPDEAGRHLEVVNFKNGFGALQIRQPAGGRPDVGLYDQGRRDNPAAVPITASDYLLFIVRAGSYDLLVRSGGKPSWHAGVDVPLDRTRLWVTP